METSIPATKMSILQYRGLKIKITTKLETKMEEEGGVIRFRKNKEEKIECIRI